MISFSLFYLCFFFKQERGLEMITPSTNRQDYIKLIDSFEDVDTPSQFGLPLNVERSVQRAKSSAVISQLKKLARSMALLGSGGSGNKFNREQWRTELGPLIELWDRLIKSSRDVLDKPKKSRSTNKGNDDKLLPLSQFVEMESSFAYDIVSLVDSNMKALKKVVFGSGLLTPQIQANGAALMANTIPRHWEKKWEGPEIPQPFLKAIVTKKIALSGWSKKMESLATSGNGVVNLNLSELFNPGTFLMALRQQTARVAKLPMDSLILSSSFGDELERAPLPVKITGLLMQGATYEDGRIELR